MASPSPRRWIVPQLVLLTAAVVVIVIAASLVLAQGSADDDIAVRRIASVAWVAALVWLATAAGLAWVVVRQQRRQRVETAQLLLRAVPAALQIRPRLAGADHDEVLHDVARAFAELMDEAGEQQ